MCVNCEKENITGLTYYSGEDLELCTGVTIVHDEDMNIVIDKIKECLDILKQEFDITGLIEDSDCINGIGNTLQEILQNIINTESDFCNRIKELEEEVEDIRQNCCNNSTSTNSKKIEISTCETGAVTRRETDSTVDFEFNVGLIPKHTILPYFGPQSNFTVDGLGINELKGWAIANGQNGTYNVCNKFIHYECDICCDIYGGSNEIILKEENLPDIDYGTINIDIDVEGETEEAGRHTHKVNASRDGGCDGCGNCGTGDEVGEDPCHPSKGFLNDNDSAGSEVNYGHMGYSGTHKHQVDLNASGQFTLQLDGQKEPIQYMPEHIKAIPIQYIGCDLTYTGPIA